MKHDRDIGRKAVLSDVKTAFTFTPALMVTKLLMAICDGVSNALLPYLCYRREACQRERVRRGENSTPISLLGVVFFEMSKQDKRTIQDLPERSCFQPGRPILFPRSFLHLLLSAKRINSDNKCSASFAYQQQLKLLYG